MITYKTGLPGALSYAGNMVAMRPPISGDSFFDISTEERFDIWVSGKITTKLRPNLTIN